MQISVVRAHQRKRTMDKLAQIKDVKLVQVKSQHLNAD